MSDIPDAKAWQALAATLKAAAEDFVRPGQDDGGRSAVVRSLVAVHEFLANVVPRADVAPLFRLAMALEDLGEGHALSPFLARAPRAESEGGNRNPGRAGNPTDLSAQKGIIAGVLDGLVRSKRFPSLDKAATWVANRVGHTWAAQRTKAKLPNAIKKWREEAAAGQDTVDMDTTIYREFSNAVLAQPDVLQAAEVALRKITVVMGPATQGANSEKPPN